jgi:hypothetical protein
MKDKKYIPKHKTLIIKDKKIPNKEDVLFYDFSRKPQVPSKFFRGLIRFIDNIMMKKIPHNVVKDPRITDAEQYLIFGTHMSFIDFPCIARVFSNRKIAYVCAIDASNDFSAWLMHHVGIIFKRKFVKDLALIKNIKYVFNTFPDASVMIYPEAKYCLHGRTSYLPPALGKLAKLMDRPVMATVLNGDYISSPQWRKKPVIVPLRTDAKLVASLEEVRKLSAEELQQRIVESLQYDDYKYQIDNNIIIDDPDRAYGLGALLYQCPICKTEHKMVGNGTTLTCTHCNSFWELSELGVLKGINCETPYETIPDWYNFEVEEVRKEILEGKYHFEDKVVIHTLPFGRLIRKLGKNGFYHHGIGKLTHDKDGNFIMEGNIYNKDIVQTWSPVWLDGLHIEYRYLFTEDCVDLSTDEDSYWCYPTTAKDVITKLSIATDIFYQLNKK